MLDTPGSVGLNEVQPAHAVIICYSALEIRLRTNASCVIICYCTVAIEIFFSILISFSLPHMFVVV